MQKAINDLKGQLVTNARTAIQAGRVDQATTLLGNANRLAHTGSRCAKSD